MGHVREPAVSGSFYPSNPDVLRRDVEGYLARAAIEPVGGEVLGIVSPHAGYVYSGQVAAYGFKTIAGAAIDTVIVIAPSHRVRFEGVALMGSGAYRTPLGDLKVDEEFGRTMMKGGGVLVENTAAHRGEHSLEVQVPFLQVALKGFQLLPLIMGSQSIVNCEFLAKSIVSAAKATGKKVLVVGSTDLSHYYSYASAVKLDNVAVEHLAAFDVKGLAGALEKNEYEACGAGPMITAMMASQGLGADAGRVMKYANSGDVSGDRSAVVGYVSAVFFKAGQLEGRSEGLSEEEKAQLKEIAKDSIETSLFKKGAKEMKVPPILEEKRGAFVTLKRHGELRGCIGYIRAVAPLYRTVRDMAVQAAFHDPRFSPLGKEEWKDIDIEISVLTPMKKIASLDEIKVGVHGLYIEKSGRSGLLLPQVATEYKWDRTMFLEYTCYKAGLPKDAYKDKDAAIYIFSAEVF